MQPLLSVIVNVHNMEREAARTLFTLSTGYQRRVALSEYEVIVIDNGSRQPLDPAMVRGFGSNFRLVTHSRGLASPAAAINAAVPGRFPMMQMRSNASTTAIELAVLWSGLQPVASREAR